MDPDPEELAPLEGEGPSGSSEMEELAAKAIRPGRKLSIEDLLASELATAALSEPLSKIRHICEALMLLDDNEKVSVGITTGELKEAKRLYKLAITLSNIFWDRFINLDGTWTDRSATIQWPFDQSEAREWKEWIAPLGLKLRWYDESSMGDEKQNADKIADVSERVFTLTQGRKIMPDNAKSFISNFTILAMPKVATIMRKIVGLVSAESYLTALRIIRGKRGKA